METKELMGLLEGPVGRSPGCSSLNLVPAQPSELSLGFSLEGCQVELGASTSILNTVPNQ